MQNCDRATVTFEMPIGFILYYGDIYIHTQYQIKICSVSLHTDTTNSTPRTYKPAMTNIFQLHASKTGPKSS